jgi:alpha-galactosidase
MSENNKGHAAHTKDAAQAGLPGSMPRPIKLTMLGAGSGFTPRLVNDVLHIPNHAGGEIALVDIDLQRLQQMEKLILRLLAQVGQEGQWKVTASPERRQVLSGSDYIVNCIEVSGLDCVRFDNDIPLKYGIDQCIGDTIGPGGLFKGLRTAPVFLEVLRDAEELCPQALVLNYTNPMNMLCLAAGRSSSMQVVGLCHSVQGTTELLAKRAGLPLSEIQWECAGINHLAWITKFAHQGQDLYPRLKELARQELAQAAAEGWTDPENMEDPRQVERPDYQRDLVRKDMMLHFGAFITESSGHLSEYLPYYRKRKDLLARYARPGYDGSSSFYSLNWPTWRAAADQERAEMIDGTREIKFERSWEYASWIIEAHQKDQPYRIHGNVMNSTAGAGPLIGNLPADGCVEVACMIDRNGINPTVYGRLPSQMAALCQSNMSFFDLAAQAVLERSKELAVYALSLDPLSATVCSPAEIKAMTLEMFEAEAPFLPEYR